MKDEPTNRTLWNGSAERVRIESDERGFELHVLSDDGDTYVWNIHGIAEEFYDSVKAAISPWLWERELAARTFRCDPDESGGYDRSDPKHPDFYSVHVDHYDNREKT